MEPLSRSAVQRMICEGLVAVNGQRAKAAQRLKSRDCVEVCWLPSKESGLEPEPLPLDVLYEDQDCIVVNKAPGMVVHPAAGKFKGTLVNALLHHCPDLQGIGMERRPGIVHRLDKDTSGVMVIAKHGKALEQIARQFKERRVRKEYLALVWGKMEGAKGRIDRPIGRHRRDRKRMSSLHFLPRSRDAITEWHVAGSFKVRACADGWSWVTLLRLKPLTGRTHQLRVHLADQGHPLVGDRVYGRGCPGWANDDVEVPGLKDFPRQALHAQRIEFTHPRTGTPVEFCAPLPWDMRRLLDALGGWRDQAGEQKKERGAGG